MYNQHNIHEGDRCKCQFWSLIAFSSLFVGYVCHSSINLCVCTLVTFDLETGGNDLWIKFNANMTGLYRVHYDDNNWWALIAQLKQDHSVSNLNTGISVSIRF